MIICDVTREPGVVARATITLRPNEGREQSFELDLSQEAYDAFLQQNWKALGGIAKGASVVRRVPRPQQKRTRSSRTRKSQPPVVDLSDTQELSKEKTAEDDGFSELTLFQLDELEAPDELEEQF
jgi:hypothetical protein